MFRGSRPFICNKVMVAEQVLKLLDTYWFETTVFTNKTPSPFHSTSQTQVVEVLLPFLDTKLLRVPTLQVRSFSDQNLGSTTSCAFSDSPSSNSVLTPQKLQTILYGKEVGLFPMENSTANHEEEEGEMPNNKKKSHIRKLRKGKTTRSLSDLEFKELKGFMDLGFVFPEGDKDSRLVSLIPGLQRLGKNDACVGAEQQQKIDDETAICRPYLSEAWGVLDQRKVVNPLLSWRVPALGNEIDMKDNLRFWAHTVASIVR